MDQLIYGYSKAKQISLTYVDVTESAKKLEQKHLSGPTAGRFLAESLVSVALLSADLKDKDERISLQVQVDGPIGGCLVDASRGGNLRGYTTKKILNKFDESDETSLDEVLGDNGLIAFIHSSSNRVISQQSVECNPLNLRFGLARYYNDLEKKPTAIEISAVSQNHNLHRATGLKITRFPEGDPEDFVPVLERFNDKTVRKALDQSVDIQIMSDMLGLDNLITVERRTLTTKCTCSREKVIYSISCLTAEELEEMVANKETPEVACHFCSETYRVSTQQLVRLLVDKQKK